MQLIAFFIQLTPRQMFPTFVAQIQYCKHETRNHYGLPIQKDPPIQMCNFVSCPKNIKTVVVYFSAIIGDYKLYLKMDNLLLYKSRAEKKQVKIIWAGFQK